MPDPRYCITQIKTRYNGLPPASIRQKIHEVLGIDMKKTGGAAYADHAGFPLYMENLRRVLPILRGNGIEKVTVSFNGTGIN